MTQRCTSRRYTRRSQSGQRALRVAIVQWESEPKTKLCGTGLVRTQTTIDFFRSGDADPNKTTETDAKRWRGRFNMTPDPPS